MPPVGSPDRGAPRVLLGSPDRDALHVLSGGEVPTLMSEVALANLVEMENMVVRCVEEVSELLGHSKEAQRLNHSVK